MVRRVDRLSRHHARDAGVEAELVDYVIQLRVARRFEGPKDLVEQQGNADFVSEWRRVRNQPLEDECPEPSLGRGV